MDMVCEAYDNIRQASDGHHARWMIHPFPDGVDIMATRRNMTIKNHMRFRVDGYGIGIQQVVTKGDDDAHTGRAFARPSEPVANDPVRISDQVGQYVGVQHVGQWHRLGLDLDFVQLPEAIIHVGKFLVQGLQRGQHLEQGGFFVDRFENQAIAILGQHDIIRLELKIPWNSNGLIATIAKQGGAPR
jgi:hypothetical protein